MSVAKGIDVARRAKVMWGTSFPLRGPFRFYKEIESGSTVGIDVAFNRVAGDIVAHVDVHLSMGWHDPKNPLRNFTDMVNLRKRSTLSGMRLTSAKTTWCLMNVLRNVDALLPTWKDKIKAAEKDFVYRASHGLITRASIAEFEIVANPGISFAEMRERKFGPGSVATQAKQREVWARERAAAELRRRRSWKASGQVKFLRRETVAEGWAGELYLSPVVIDGGNGKVFDVLIEGNLYATRQVTFKRKDSVDLELRLGHVTQGTDGFGDGDVNYIFEWAERMAAIRLSDPKVTGKMARAVKRGDQDVLFSVWR